MTSQTLHYFLQDLTGAKAFVADTLNIHTLPNFYCAVYASLVIKQMESKKISPEDVKMLLGLRKVLFNLLGDNHNAEGFVRFKGLKMGFNSPALSLLERGLHVLQLRQTAPISKWDIEYFNTPLTKLGEHSTYISKNIVEISNNLQNLPGSVLKPYLAGGKPVVQLLIEQGAEALKGLHHRRTEHSSLTAPLTPKSQDKLRYSAYALPSELLDAPRSSRASSASFPEPRPGAKAAASAPAAKTAGFSGAAAVEGIPVGFQEVFNAWGKGLSSDLAKAIAEHHQKLEEARLAERLQDKADRRQEKLAEKTIRDAEKRLTNMNRQADLKSVSDGYSKSLSIRDKKHSTEMKGLVEGMEYRLSNEEPTWYAEAKTTESEKTLAGKAIRVLNNISAKTGNAGSKRKRQALDDEEYKPSSSKGRSRKSVGGNGKGKGKGKENSSKGEEEKEEGDHTFFAPDESFDARDSPTGPPGRRVGRAI